MTKAQINRTALTRLKMYTPNGTIVVFCPRIQVGDYLRHNHCRLIEVCGQRFNFGIGWEIILN